MDEMQLMSKTNDNKTGIIEIRGMIERNECLKEITKKLHEAICQKLDIDDPSDCLRDLVIVSIKKNFPSNYSSDAVKQLVEKYDCHQQNLVTQKKVLLMLFVEKSIGIYLSDDEASKVITVSDYAEALAKKWKGEKNGKNC